MPIEVHCPNPACARIHIVKNKYAGMRGRCPACQSWMYIPVTGAMPSMNVPRPAAVEEPPAWLQQQTQKAAARPVATMVQHSALPEEPALRPEPAALEPEPAEVAEVLEASAEPAAPKKYFSWVAVFLLLLGILSLGAVSAAPYLETASVTTTGDFARSPWVKPQFIPTDMEVYVMSAPAAAAGPAVLCLLLALIMRRFRFIHLGLLYVSLLAAAVLFFVALTWYHRETSVGGPIHAIEKMIAERKGRGDQGDATLSLGLQAYALLAGTGGACVFFLLTALFMHKRWWSRILGFFFLAFWPALLAAWVYSKELGIDGMIPIEFPQV
jgi:hypothetical protein